MHIQLNSDSHVVASPALATQAETILVRELKHRADDITRIEVHLSDVNSGRGGDDDKRCLLEARVSGLPPIAAEHRAGTIELAISGAAAQLARAVDGAVGKARATAKGNESIRRTDHVTDKIEGTQ